MKEPTEEQIINLGDNEKEPTSNNLTSTNEPVGPTPEELETLPRIADKIPYTIFMVVIAEAAERFTFRSITGPLQNYVQNPLHDDRLPGALGKGQATATAIGYFFQCWCFLMPIVGAVIADCYLGRVKTILLGSITATIGTLILFLTSLPVSLENGAGWPGLLVALIIIGLGAGGIKSNVGPLVADQYTGKKPVVKITADNRRVILDPDVTVQTIYSRYYWLINIGSCAGLIAPWVERKVGFWATFLIPLCIYGCATVVLIFCRNKYIIRPPQGSIAIRAAHALWIGFKKNRTMDHAKPSYLRQQGERIDLPWDDQFVDEIKVALMACRVISLFPIFWLCYGNTVGNLISLAGLMNTMGLPNDFLAGSINPLSILILLPLFERVIYPSLRRINIPFRPISRITFGFVIMSGAIAVAAGLQSLAYNSPPYSVNFLSILPIYVLTALSEITAFLSSMEYAYTKAPRSMKSLVASVNLLLCALGSLLGLAISPTSKKPQILVQFACLSGIMFLAAILVYVLFSKYNKVDEKMNQIEREADSDREG
ncbi:POT family-domain-containing protein [Aspergillus transmontanensis]|uniref:POT family-domain-containing protein n=1 Tax=Aspergillus transmontanensis TaxID=1034304 RepID=A0A5N6W0F8_9EURO|nr:POT family-domain-containing protein [Aspergillus transmontanensis]